MVRRRGTFRCVPSRVIASLRIPSSAKEARRLGQGPVGSRTTRARAWASNPADGQCGIGIRCANPDHDGVAGPQAMQDGQGPAGPLICNGKNRWPVRDPGIDRLAKTGQTTTTRRWLLAQRPQKFPARAREGLVLVGGTSGGEYPPNGSHSGINGHHRRRCFSSIRVFVPSAKGHDRFCIREIV